RPCDHGNDGEKGEEKAEQEDPRRDLRYTQTLGDGTLIEMRFVRREERLARDDAAGKRERRVGYRIERQEKPGGEVRLGYEDQHEGKAKSDRKAAGVAEKHLGRMLVESGEAEDGPYTADAEYTSRS